MNETTAPRGVLIRPATAADMAEITRIYAFAVDHGTATFEIDPPDETEMARRHAALTASGYPYLVAQHGGAIAGYAYAGSYRARPAYRWSVEDSIYIAPEFYRQGIGLALLNRLVAESAARGFRQMIAVIRRLGADSVDRRARQSRLRPYRHVTRGRVQTWPLARYSADAARAGPRRCGAAIAVRPRPVAPNDRARRGRDRVPCRAAG